MFALTWTDIDWRAETVSIFKAIQRDRNGLRVNNSTKTGRKGDRVLPLGKMLVDLLKRTRKERMARGNASEYVFCRSDGRALNKDTFAYEWKTVRDALGLPEGPTFYSLKTAGNSYALANGVSSAAQAKKMGHTSTRMADNTYRHLMGVEIINAVEVYGRRSTHVGRGEKIGLTQPLRPTFFVPANKRAAKSPEESGLFCFPGGSEVPGKWRRWWGSNP